MKEMLKGSLKRLPRLREEVNPEAYRILRNFEDENPSGIDPAKNKAAHRYMDLIETEERASVLGCLQTGKYDRLKELYHGEIK